MNRMALESVSGGRRVTPVGSQQLRRGRITVGEDTREGDEISLDLFSGTRGGGHLISLSNVSDGQNEPIKLEKISVGSGRIGRSGMEDLLDAEIGKHDYDWLLTPPETPQFPSSVAKESQLSSTAPRGRTTGRSVSNARPSRLSASQSENGHSTRPVRSSSVTRSSISNTYSSSSFSNNNNRTSVLNTSSASVTSSRPSTPGSRSTTARPSSTARLVPSRLPTPTKTRPNPTSFGDRTTRPNPISSGDRSIRPSHNSRPSTPSSSRPQTPPNPNPNLNPRSNSRPSTPTRRLSTSTASLAPTGGSRFPSVGRIPSANSRNPLASASRPSSPGPRARAPVRPIDLPDFPTDVPPNLRTKLPERPASAGRTRPGMALTVRANSNSEAVAAMAAVPVSSNRRNYLPVVSRGRFPENPPKATTKLHSNNGHEATPPPEVQRAVVSDGGVRRCTKPASADSNGFGRTISKKSLDMALRHMDIRQGMGGIRASSLFPQSIRSTAPKGRPARKSDSVVPLANDEAIAENGSCNGTISPDCSRAASENGDFVFNKSRERESLGPRENELDLHGSSRYDAILLKEEDSKNMSWLHSIEDKSDEGLVFDHRFEPLPEPFGLL